MKLTKAQRRYLTEMSFRGRLCAGWAGYRSTLVIRNLEQKGLVRARYFPFGGWQASITNKGRAALEREP